MADGQYKIGIEMALSGTITQALVGVAAQLTGLHGQVGRIHMATKDWGATLGVLAGTVILGAVVGALDEVLKKTKDINSVLTELKTMGASPAELAGLNTQANAVVPNIPGMTKARYEGIYASIRDMFFKSKPEDLEKVMPDLAKFEQTMVNEGLLHGKTAESSDNDLRSVIRAEDLMAQFSDKEGNLDPVKFRNFMDFATRVYIGTHGAINPKELLNIGKQGGISLSNLDEHGLYAAAAVAQQMGGNRFGTAEMSLFQQFAGGTMNANRAKALQELGILKEGDWKTSRGGGVELTSSGHEHLQAILGTGDPVKFAEALKKAMVDIGIKDPNEQILKVFEVLARATTQRMVGDALRNTPQMEGEIEALRSGQGLNDAFKTQQEAIAVAQNNIASAMTNLYTAIGEGHGTQIAGFLNTISTDIQTLASAVNSLSDGHVGTAAQDLMKLSSAITAVLNVLGGGPGGWAIEGGKWLQNRFFNRHHIDPGTPSDTFGGKAIPQNFIGPSNGVAKPTIIHTNLNLDGHSLAQDISEKVAEILENPSGAYASNDVSLYNNNGYNPGMG